MFRGRSKAVKCLLNNNLRTIRKKKNKMRNNQIYSLQVMQQLRKDCKVKKKFTKMD